MSSVTLSAMFRASSFVAWVRASLALAAVVLTVWLAAPVVWAGSPAQVTFSGFSRGRAGDGTLFVHVSQRTNFTVESSGNRVTVRLTSAAIDVRNNRHPLDLTHFNLLLVTSRMVEKGDDVELQLELRRPTQLEPRWVERKDGVVSLHVPIPALRSLQ